MIDVIDLIPSNDMKNALRESGRVFSDMEKATIIANIGLPRQTRLGLLEDLAAETEDDMVREQIRYSLVKEQRLLDRFRENAGDHVYGVQIRDEDFDETDSDQIDAYFFDYKLAFDFGKSQKAPFEIRKWLVHASIPEERRYDCDGFCGSLEFDENGELRSTWLWGEEDEQPQFFPNIKIGRWSEFFYFEDRWLDLPNLYELGDIVRVFGNQAGYIDPAYDWAVVDCDRERWEEYRERVNKWLHAIESGEDSTDGSGAGSCAMGDYSDMQITLEFPCKDGTFQHDHINPMFIESVGDEATGYEAELREMASQAVRGKCSLEQISTVLKRRTS